MPAENNVDNSPPKLGIPYEASLTKAFDKLTSQVLIFLLAYVILLIGLAAFGSDLPNTLHSLLHIIPVLGVGAYVWSQQRNIAQEAVAKGLDIKGGIIRDSAKLTGARGATGQIPENIKLDVGYASGHAEVTGVDYGGFEEPRGNLAQAMSDIYKELDQSSQVKLLGNAQRLLETQRQLRQ